MNLQEAIESLKDIVEIKDKILGESVRGAQFRKPKKPGRSEKASDDLIAKLKDFVQTRDSIRSDPPARVQSVSLIRKRLDWLFKIIDGAPKRFRSTGNTLVKGRFYTFNYSARYDHLPWDARPVVLVLDKKFQMGVGRDLRGERRLSGYTGMLGINFHYMPLKIRRQAMKSLIQTNKARFQKNQPLTVEGLMSMPFMGKAIKKYGALRQYHYAKNLPNKDGVVHPVGMFNIKQIPYDLTPEILSIPSIYDPMWKSGKSGK